MQELSRVQIDQADVKSIEYAWRRRLGRRGSRIIGVDAWIRLETCDGSVVINMDRFCRVRQIYSRDGCQLPNIEAY